MYKTVVFVLAALTFGVFSVNSQVWRVNAYALYTLDDDIETIDGAYYYNGTVKGNLLWGGGIEYSPNKVLGIELAYFRQDTDVPSNYNIGTTHSETFKLGANYILLGGNSYLSLPNKRIEPFAGMMFGAAILENKEPKPGAQSTVTKFAWEVKAGVNIMASKQFGFKLQAQLLSVVQGGGGGLYVGTGGTGAGLSTYSTMYQMGFGGGLVFKFGKK